MSSRVDWSDRSSCVVAPSTFKFSMSLATFRRNGFEFINIKKEQNGHQSGTSQHQYTLL